MWIYQFVRLHCSQRMCTDVLHTHTHTHTHTHIYIYIYDHSVVNVSRIGDYQNGIFQQRITLHFRVYKVFIWNLAISRAKFYVWPTYKSILIAVRWNFSDVKFFISIRTLPMAVAARSTAWVSGRSLAAIVDSNSRGFLQSVIWYDREASRMRRPWHTRGLSAIKIKDGHPWTYTIVSFWQVLYKS